jgi:hypothetical protein
VPDSRDRRKMKPKKALEDDVPTSEVVVPPPRHGRGDPPGNTNPYYERSKGRGNSPRQAARHASGTRNGMSVAGKPKASIRQEPSSRIGLSIIFHKNVDPERVIRIFDAFGVDLRNIWQGPEVQPLLRIELTKPQLDQLKLSLRDIGRIGNFSEAA